MIRSRNWSADLVQWAQGEIGRSYAWGETDCGSLVRRGLAVVYGAPIGQVPAYDSLEAAMRVAEQTGGVAGQLVRRGAETIGLKFATTGDIIVADDWPADSDGFEAASLCLGPTILTSDPGAGVHVLPRPREGAFVAYRLPHELLHG